VRAAALFAGVSLGDLEFRTAMGTGKAYHDRTAKTRLSDKTADSYSMPPEAETFLHALWKALIQETPGEGNPLAGFVSAVRYSPAGTRMIQKSQPSCARYRQ
jgi:hypothetical protein